MSQQLKVKCCVGELSVTCGRERIRNVADSDIVGCNAVELNTDGDERGIL